MGELKFKSKKQLRYIALHRDIVEKGFKWTGYFYTGDLSGICACSKTGLAHNFVLTNDKDEEIVLGSTCINRNLNYQYIFKEKPELWKKLQDELKGYKELFRMIRNSPEYKKKRVTLEELRELQKAERKSWRDEKDALRLRTVELLPEIEAYNWVTQNSFITSIMTQAQEGRGLSDRQLEVFNNIQNQFNDQNNLTVEQVLEDFNEWKNTPHLIDDFLTISFYLRLGRYDRDLYDRTANARSWDENFDFSDSDYDKALKMLYKYRKQLNVKFWEMVKVPDRTSTMINYIEAFNRLVEKEIIPIISQK